MVSLSAEQKHFSSHLNGQSPTGYCVVSLPDTGQRQTTSVMRAQGSGHMDTGEAKPEPAVLYLAVLHGQVGGRPQLWEPVPWHLLCWTSCLATATGRMSKSSCVYGQKNGTLNLMFLDGHPQISVKSPYLSPNQTEDFDIPQV